MALSGDAFEKLLGILSSERDAAGAKYELIRLKLVKYFEWRHCPYPEEMADETLDRVARRLLEGQEIQSGELLMYVYGVARNVLLEFWKSRQRERDALDAAGRAVRTSDEELALAERRFSCQRKCLGRQPRSSQDLLARYYQVSGAAKTDHRLAMAREMGIPPNALRIRIHRIKSEILRCLDECMRRDADTFSLKHHNKVYR